MNSFPQLGKNLRAARKKRFPLDDMKAFALRLGISRATLQKMEKGDLSVSFKYYYLAAKLLSVDEAFNQLFVISASLLDD